MTPQLLTPLEAVGEELAARVDARARRENYASDPFQTIASEELGELDQELEIDYRVIADFIQRTSVPQGRHWFSDIPLVIANRKNFCVQLLYWSTATTMIHDHAFCGAFRLIRGSSLHTTYSFAPERWISDQLALGKLNCQGSEYLHKDHIRKIAPGKDGLIHSLYHLETPSLTLLVRTHKNTAATPQLGFLRPGLAIDLQGLADDEEVRNLARLITVMSQQDSEIARLQSMEILRELDAPRMVRLCLDFLKFFSSDLARTELTEMVNQRHDKYLADCLSQVLERQQLELELKSARNAIRDPDLRYFMALLLNFNDKVSIHEMIRARFPDRDPVSQCSEWLFELSKTRSMAKALMEETAAKLSNAGFRLGAKIANCLQAEGGVSQIRDILENERDSTEASKRLSPHPLSQIKALAPLFK